MTEGERLARELLKSIPEADRTRMIHASGDFRDGYLLGRFSQDHSAVALYNAGGHIVRLIQGDN